MVAGRASIHFCITVHRFGVPFPGVMPLIAAFERVGLHADSEFGSPGSNTMGNRACHSPSRRAMPRQTSSRVRSSGVQTRPLMNRYSRPFWKRASSGGARLRWESRECEIVSPANISESRSYELCGLWSAPHTVTVNEDFCTAPVRSQKNGFFIYLLFGISGSPFYSF